MDKKAPELVCGGIYEYTDPHETLRQGLLVYVTKMKNDVPFGVIHWAGYKPEQVLINSERWSNLKLIGRPAPAVIEKPKLPAPRTKTTVGRPKKKS